MKSGLGSHGRSFGSVTDQPVTAALSERDHQGCLQEIPLMHGPSCDPAAENLAIGAEYLDANEPAVREQLQKAAVRLARPLDTAFAN